MDSHSTHLLVEEEAGELVLAIEGARLLPRGGRHAEVIEEQPLVCLGCRLLFQQHQSYFAISMSLSWL
jgi:hypothetical protein